MNIHTTTSDAALARMTLDLLGVRRPDKRSRYWSGGRRKFYRVSVDALIRDDWLFAAGQQRAPSYSRLAPDTRSPSDGESSFSIAPDLPSIPLRPASLVANLDKYVDALSSVADSIDSYRSWPHTDVSAAWPAVMLAPQHRGPDGLEPFEFLCFASQAFVWHWLPAAAAAAALVPDSASSEVQVHVSTCCNLIINALGNFATMTHPRYRSDRATETAAEASRLVFQVGAVEALTEVLLLVASSVAWIAGRIDVGDGDSESVGRLREMQSSTHAAHLRAHRAALAMRASRQRRDELGADHMRMLFDVAQQVGPLPVHS